MPEYAKNTKLTIEYIKEFSLKENCICISNIYKNIKSKLEFKCSNGHIFYMDFEHFRRGKRCAECAGNKKHTIEYIKSFVQKNGYECLSSHYINGSSKLDFICPEGHKCSISFNNFYNHNRRCGKCFGPNKYSIEDIKKLTLMEGYVCLSECFIKIKTKLKLLCPNAHECLISFDDFKYGARCKICSDSDSESKHEKIIRYLLEYSTGYLLKPIRHPLIINPITNKKLQLDGYNNEISFAFEYQGAQHYRKIKSFHMDDNSLKRQKYRDRIKVEACKENNIKLLIIPTIPELLHFKDVKSFLEDKLNEMNIKIINEFLDFKDAMKKILREETIEKLNAK